MPTCSTITQGFVNACLGGIPGAKQIFLGNWADFNGTMTLNADREITAMPTATLYRVEGLRNSVSATDNVVNNIDLGTQYFTQTATAKVSRLDAEKHLEILGKYSKAKLIIFVQLQTNKIVCLGLENGCFMSQGNAGSGLAKGDFEGYDLIFAAEEPTQAPFCTAFTTNPFDQYAGITVTPDFNS